VYSRIQSIEMRRSPLTYFPVLWVVCLSPTVDQFRFRLDYPYLRIIYVLNLNSK
jgi:hypothetical protein